MKFKDFLWGKEGKKKAISPEAEETWKQLLEGGITEDELYQMGGDYMKQLMGGDYAAFEQPLIEQFEQQIVPGIAERFAGVGGMSSSGLNLALSEAAKGLSTQLGAQRAQLMYGMLPQALQYAQAPYQQQQAALGVSPYYYQRGQEGLIPGAAKGFAAGIGQGAGRGAAAGMYGGW